VKGVEVRGERTDDSLQGDLLAHRGGPGKDPIHLRNQTPKEKIERERGERGVPGELTLGAMKTPLLRKKLAG